METASHSEAHSASPRSFQAQSRSIHQQLLAMIKLNWDCLVLQQASPFSRNFHGRLHNDCEVEVAMGLCPLPCILYLDNVAMIPSLSGLQTFCSTLLCDNFIKGLPRRDAILSPADPSCSRNPFPGHDQLPPSPPPPRHCQPRAGCFILVSYGLRLAPWFSSKALSLILLIVLTS